MSYRTIDIGQEYTASEGFSPLAHPAPSHVHDTYEQRIERANRAMDTTTRDVGATYATDYSTGTFHTISVSGQLTESTPLLSTTSDSDTYSAISSLETGIPANIAHSEPCSFCRKRGRTPSLTTACANTCLYLACLCVLLSTVTILIAAFFAIIGAWTAFIELLPIGLLFLGSVVYMGFTIATACLFQDVNKLRDAMWEAFLMTEKALVISGGFVLMVLICMVVPRRAGGWS